MNKDSSLVWLLGSHVLVASLLCGHWNLARGQEAPPPLPPERAACQTAGHDVEALERVAKTLLAELGPGFAIHVTKLQGCEAAGGACAGGACESPTECEEMIARLGVNFEGTCAAGACSERPAKFVSLGCACAASGDCHCAGKETCQCCSCGSEATSGSETACGAEHAAALASHEEQRAGRLEKHTVQLKSHEQCPFVQHMANLIAESASARAELASRKEASEKMAEMYEAMAELIAANAALHAKLEAQEEHFKLAEKLAHLATENARLKTHVELAGGSTQAGQHALTLTLENERLKARVGELEQKHAQAQATRTAAKARSDRKAR
jgi:hypothetical protein